MQLSPTSRKVSTNDFELLSPTVRVTALGGRVAPEIICQFLVSSAISDEYLPVREQAVRFSPSYFSYLGLAPEAMSRGTA